MKIHCHTNLDLHFSEEWPFHLPCRPMVGDIITSNQNLELQVVRVTFPHDPLEAGVINVELHLVPSRFEHIEAFQKWYKKQRKM